MNRRSFFTKLGLAAASFAVLPAATTYARHWVKSGPILTPTCLRWKEVFLNPLWEQAEYELACCYRAGELGTFHGRTGSLPPNEVIRSVRYNVEMDGSFRKTLLVNKFLP